MTYRGIGDSKTTTWFLYRRGKPLVDAESKSTLGYEAIYLGTAQIIRGGDPAVVQVTSATQEILIGDKLVAAGIQVDKRRIHLHTPVKTLGRHEVKVKLHADVTVELGFDVVSENPIEPVAAEPAAKPAKGEKK